MRLGEPLRSQSKENPDHGCRAVPFDRTHQALGTRSCRHQDHRRGPRTLEKSEQPQDARGSRYARYRCRRTRTTESPAESEDHSLIWLLPRRAGRLLASQTALKHIPERVVNLDREVEAVGRPGERRRRDGDVPRAAGTIAVPAARIQLVTVLRPRARRAPRNCLASLGADLRSRNGARRENSWHAGVSWCENVMAGSVRC